MEKLCNLIDCLVFRNLQYCPWAIQTTKKSKYLQKSKEEQKTNGSEYVGKPNRKLVDT